MEFGSGRSGHDEGEGAKVERRSQSSGGGGGGEDHREQETVVTQEPPMTDIARSMEGAGPNTSSPRKEEVDELENTKAEMGGVIQENQRLKTCLNRILNDYRTLQMQFHNIAEQDTKTSSDKANNNNHNQDKMMEESELVSLSLGRLPSNPRNNEKAKVISRPLKEEENREGLALGLDCKFETSKSGSTDNSSELPLKEDVGETWKPSKVDKTSITIPGEDEVSQQNNPAKKTRVCVRARCDTLTMNDGCQWRKYGQKISKGNPCPRAYYRCTVAPSCPVRKQVQRCAQDMSILITTYEGNHNHPLPLSATAMASTTSAAASMLLSGSSTSHAGSTTADLHGMNFCLSDGSKSKQFYMSHPALSPSPSHPTITLDLTTSNNNLPLSSLPFGRFTSNFNNPPRYPSSTSLNFSNSESNAMSWSNGFLSYNTSLPYNNNNILSNLGRQQQQQPMENNILNSYMQRNNNNVPTDTIAEATKAITADPTFQSALAAALTSIIGSTGSSTTTQGLNQNNVGEILGKKRKWEELFPSSSSTLPFSIPKSASASPDDNRD